MGASGVRSTGEFCMDEVLQAGWNKLPQSYRMPDRTPSLTEAQAYCRKLAESHYENFHVATWFLPKRLRPHFHSIYAYCRISDDLGDEVGDVRESLALLDFWNGQLDACYRGIARHPVFVALAETIRACNIPKKPFADLLIAFRQDQTVTRYRTMEDLFGYCVNSANPVGHLVLYACGYRDAELFTLSDFTCTALQLANFWQDVGEDDRRGRIYLPLADMERFGATEQQIRERRFSIEFRNLMEHEVSFAHNLFAKGLPLVGRVDKELAIDLELFNRGGQEILHAIQRRGYDVLGGRPEISKPRKAQLLLRALMGKMTTRSAA